MSEEDEARREFAAEFPHIGAHLARERGELPVYGPTVVVDDEGVTPDVVIRVAYALSRQQLLAALTIGFTEMLPTLDADHLSTEDVRREVETWFGNEGITQIDRHVEQGQLTAYPVEAQPVMDALAAALDRAYPPRTVQPVRRAPRYGDGTVTLETVDHGDVTEPEPAWCVGHSWQPNPHRADITHNSVRVKAAATTDGAGRVPLLHAYISHSPHLEFDPEPYPVVSVELECTDTFVAEDIPQLAEGLRSAARVLENVAAEAIRLRGES